MCAMNTTALPVPSVGNALPTADLQATSALDLSNPRVTKASIYSSVTTDSSQTVFGAGTYAGSIFSSLLWWIWI
jgi:hypothetical protein